MDLKITIEIEGWQAGIVERDLQGTAEEIEEQAREATQRTGRIVLETAFQHLETACSGRECCGHRMESRGHRLLTLVSAFGSLTVWRREGLKVPKKPRKERRLGSSAHGCVRHRVGRRNQVWAWDFIFDRTANGTSLKWLSVVDEYTRECLCLKVSRRMTSRDIIEVLRGLFLAHGVPEQIRSDNGPEFIAKVLREWLERWSAVHRAGVTVGERLRGEFSFEVSGRVPGLRGV